MRVLSLIKKPVNTWKINKETSEYLEDTESCIDILEQVHRLNRILESKEEQLLTLNLELKMLTESNETKEFSVDTSATACFDTEVKIYRELNAKLLRDISENSSVIENLQDETDNRKKLVTQLEFDVNVIERESKRLQTDLDKIEGIGNVMEDNIREQKVSKDSFTHFIPNTSDIYHKDSALVKSVKFLERNNALALKSFAFQPPIEENKYIRQSVLKGGSEVRAGLGLDGSDASSDTGVSSLSSSEGDYSLSTLV